MKMVIIIVVALILGVAAAAGMFFLMGGKLPEKEKITRLPPPSEEVLEHWPVDLGAMQFPTYRGGRVSAFVNVGIKMTLRGDYDAKFLNPHLPVMKDTLIRQYFKKQVPMTPDGLRVNYRRIEKDVQKMVDEMFLPGLVLDVSAELGQG